MIVVLHNIRSAHNVGSIFRTADAAGCGKLFLCGITPGPKDRFGRENKAVTKVALGAEGYLEWEHQPSTVKLLDRLRQDGFAIVAIEQSKQSISLRRLPFGLRRKKKMALVVGNEIHGLSKTILTRADYIVEIPMQGRKESLNVAVAFGVVAFALLPSAR